MTQFLTPTNGPNDSDAIDPTVWEPLLREQTELHIAVHVIKNLFQEPYHNLDDLVSFSLAAVVNTGKYNETHTLMQIDLGGEMRWLPEPIAADARQTMLYLYRDAFMTREALRALQRRYNEILGLDGLEILRTRVENYRFYVRTGETTLDGDGLDGPAPEDLMAQNNVRLDKRTAMIIVAVLISSSLILAATAFYLSKHHTVRENSTEVDNDKQHHSITVSIPSDEEGGMREIEQPKDDSANESLESGENEYLPSGLTENEQPGAMLRDWKDDQPKAKYGQSVRKDRPKSSKPISSIRIVALEPSSTNPEQRSAKTAVTRHTTGPSASKAEKIESLLAKHAVSKSKIRAAMHVRTGSLEETLDDLYSLNDSDTQSSGDIDKSSVSTEKSIFDAPSAKLNLLAAVNQAKQTDHLPPVADRPSRYASLVQSLVDEHDVTATVRRHEELSSEKGSSTGKDGLKRAWIRDDDDSCSAKQSDTSVGVLIRSWEYDEQSTIEQVSSDHEEADILQPDETKATGDECPSANRDQSMNESLTADDDGLVHSHKVTDETLPTLDVSDQSNAEGDEQGLQHSSTPIGSVNG